MRTGGAWLGTALVIGLMYGPLQPAVGQVRIGVDVEHESVLENEPVIATVSIGNDADTPMVFGPDAFNATLTLVLRRGVRRMEELPADTMRQANRRIIVLPGEVHREMFDLGSLFPMHEQRTYRLSVRIEHEDIAYSSRERVFDIVSGIEIASAVYPVPGYRDRKLTYSLRYWRRRQSEHLFLVVNDRAAGIAYGTFDLGRMIRFTPPVLRYDHIGTISVVHQSGRERFTRSRFSISGEGVDFRDQDHMLPDGSPYPRDVPVGILRDPPRPAAE